MEYVRIYMRATVAFVISGDDFRSIDVAELRSMVTSLDVHNVVGPISVSMLCAGNFRWSG